MNRKLLPCLLFLLFFLSTANALILSTNQTLIAETTDTTPIGMRITVGSEFNMTVYNITKVSDEGSTRCLIINVSSTTYPGTVLAQGSFSGNTCTLATPYKLIRGDYRFIIDSNGASRQRTSKQSITLPIANNPYINWSHQSYYSGSWQEATGSGKAVYGINSIGVILENNTPEPVTIGETLERVVSVKQLSGATTAITGTTYQTILTGTFNQTNTTTAYGYYKLTLQFTNPSQPSTTTCRLLIDGIDYNSTQERSNTGSGTYGSIAQLTSTFELATTGEHNATIECRNSGAAGTVNIQNAAIIIHELISQTGLELNYKEFTFNQTLNNVTAYIQGPQTNITTTSEGPASGLVKSIVLNYAGTYIHNAALTSAYWELKSPSVTTTCGLVQRSGNIGSTGSVGDYCALYDVGDNEVVNATLFFQGNAVVAGEVILKEFIHLPNALNYSKTAIESYNASDYTTFLTTNINFTGSQKDIVSKAALSVSTDNPVSKTFQLRPIRQNTTNGSATFRTTATNEIYGVMLVADVFVNNSAGSNYISLQRASPDNTGGFIAASGSFLNYVAIDVPFSPRSFNVTIFDAFNNAALSNFTVKIENGPSFMSSDGTAEVIAAQDTVTIILQKDGYVNTTHTVSTLSNQNLKIYRPAIYTYAFTGNKTQGNISYVRDLTYTVNYTCADTSLSLLILRLNGTINSTTAMPCSNAPQDYTQTIRYSTEGPYSVDIEFLILSSPWGNSVPTTNFYSDLTPPTAILRLFTTQGFLSSTTEINLTCIDNLITTLDYNITVNYMPVYNQSQPNGTQVNITSSAGLGMNTAVGYCYDGFQTGTDSESFELITRQFFIVDERTGNAFDVTNVSLLRLYYDDNRTYYDFKTTNSSQVNITTTGQEKLRLEIQYSNGIIITRYIDITLTDDSPRLCANTEGVTHYELLIASSTEKAVVLKNVYADCYIAADYTRFAYQDALILKAYSIASNYYLYTIDGTEQVLLASVDGSIATSINLDTLEFAQQAYNINILGDALGFNTLSNSTVEIYYINQKGDNTALRAIIEDEETGTVYLNTTSFINANAFTLYFDFSTLSVTNETVFKFTLIKTKADGTEETKISYFNTLAKSGLIDGKIVFMLGVMFLVFGLTIASTSVTLGWLGILVFGFNIAFCSLSQPAWYVTFLQVFNVIGLVFVAILAIGRNPETIG